MSSQRPYLLIANSSWYLAHYRRLLLCRLAKSNHIVTLAPVDQFSDVLAEHSVYIPWRINRSSSLKPSHLIVSFLRLFFLVRAIKPSLIHSHTLKPNLLISVVSSLFGIPCVLSFAGLGRLPRSSKFSFLIFRAVVRTIVFFSLRQRVSRLFFSSEYPLRVQFVFQNPHDLSIFKSLVPSSLYNRLNTSIIVGSGAPIRFFQQPESAWSTAPRHPHLTLVYCGRLLKSKGILDFIALSQLYPQHTLSVFGAVDPSSNDTLSNVSISRLSLSIPNITFHGATLDPMIQCLQANSILIIPSTYGEGFPRAAAEAMALSIPCVVTNSASSSLLSSEHVYLVDSPTPDNLQSAIEQICRDHEAGILLKKLHSARAFARKYLSEESVVNQTLDLYSNPSFASHPYLSSKDQHKKNEWISG